ncbi:hypothetical protein [Nostoc sp. CCY 9925]|uniref:hypothetical protein n=1 Tax=Nostoc sp. CCY 9925 TaxID=3103865 RepID=UPI0039C756CE
MDSQVVHSTFTDRRSRSYALAFHGLSQSKILISGSDRLPLKEEIQQAIENAIEKSLLVLTRMS